MQRGAVLRETTSIARGSTLSRSKKTKLVGAVYTKVVTSEQIWWCTLESQRKSGLKRCRKLTKSFPVCAGTTIYVLFPNSVLFRLFLKPLIVDFIQFLQCFAVPVITDIFLSSDSNLSLLYNTAFCSGQHTPNTTCIVSALAFQFRLEVHFSFKSREGSTSPLFIMLWFEEQSSLRLEDFQKKTTSESVFQEHI